MTKQLYCFNVSSAEEFLSICEQIGVTDERLRKEKSKYLSRWFPWLTGKNYTWWTDTYGNLVCNSVKINDFLRSIPEYKEFKADYLGEF